MDNKKKKRKGFTLIELIAVIAILAILGAILVPKISGYTAKANKSKVREDARIVLSAINAYNAEDPDTPLTTAGTTLTTVSVPTYLQSKTIPQLEAIISATDAQLSVTGSGSNITAVTVDTTK